MQFIKGTAAVNLWKESYRINLVFISHERNQSQKIPWKSPIFYSRSHIEDESTMSPCCIKSKHPIEISELICQFQDALCSIHSCPDLDTGLPEIDNHLNKCQSKEIIKNTCEDKFMELETVKGKKAEGSLDNDPQAQSTFSLGLFVVENQLQ